MDNLQGDAVSVEERIDALTKKHADSEGGGHYKASNGSWCCKNCRKINAALRELAQEFEKGEHHATKDTQA